MALVPQTGLDLSMLSLGSNNWNTGLGSSLNFGFQQPQVFSVLELPRVPLLADHFGLTKVSRRTNDMAGKLAAPKIELPSFADLNDVATKQETSEFDAEGVEENDPNFALYLNSAKFATSAASASTTPAPLAPLTAALSGKQNKIAMIVRFSPASDAAAIAQINSLFDSLSSTYRNMESLTSHLPC